MMISRLLAVAALGFALIATAPPAHAFEAGFDGADYIEAGDRVCNGGSCLTKNGSTLNCPTSGGPTCEAGEACTCRCIRLDDGSYTAANHCGKIKARAVSAMRSARSVGAASIR